jgi:hypothetical protein
MGKSNQYENLILIEENETNEMKRTLKNMWKE